MAMVACSTCRSTARRNSPTPSSTATRPARSAWRSASNPTVGEVAGTGTDLDDYESSIACTGDSTASSSNSGPLELGELAAGDVVDGTITNKRKPRVTVTKDLVPDGDGGLFDLQVNGSDGIRRRFPTATRPARSAWPWGRTRRSARSPAPAPISTITSPRSRAPATARLRRRTRVRWELGELAAGDVVDCTITNKRKPRVTVTKALVPR